MVYLLKKKILFIERMGQGSPLPGAGLGLFTDGSQSVVVICRSTYEPGGRYMFRSPTNGLILAGC